MPTTDRIDCIPQDQLSDVVKSIESEGEKVITQFKTNCGWTVVYTMNNALSGNSTTPGPVSHGGGSASNGSGSGSIPAGHIAIEVGLAEVDALARVAQSEVGHFGKYGQDQLEGGVEAVVDTILNRVAHPSYPASIQSVVDQPFQFSAINSTGSWTGLPVAKANVSAIVTEHVRARSTGKVSTVHGAMHFLNPYLSSANALAIWGNHVKANPVAIFGNDAKKDVHYHGMAPGSSLPPAYAVVFAGSVSAFSGNGALSSSTAGVSSMANRIAKICLDEWEAFGRGSKKGADDPQYLRVGDYWASIGQPHNGRTQIVNNSTGKSYNPPWSAAFISFVLRKAGAGNGFEYAQAHCHYVQDFIKGRSDSVYQAMHPDHYAPKLGDIVHYGRLGAKKFDFAEAVTIYQVDSFYPSHSDIVVEVDTTGGVIRTIGGNVGNSVEDKRFEVNSKGILGQRKDGNDTYPWIAVLRLMK